MYQAIKNFFTPVPMINTYGLRVVNTEYLQTLRGDYNFYIGLIKVSLEGLDKIAAQISKNNKINFNNVHSGKSMAAGAGLDKVHHILSLMQHRCNRAKPLKGYNMPDSLVHQFLIELDNVHAYLEDIK